jgi:hypothetical protein
LTARINRSSASRSVLLIRTTRGLAVAVVGIALKSSFWQE